MISCLRFYTQVPSEKGCSLKGKHLLPREYFFCKKNIAAARTELFSRTPFLSFASKMGAILKGKTLLPREYFLYIYIKRAVV